jgi:hypothetical protein
MKKLRLHRETITRLELSAVNGRAGGLVPKDDAGDTVLVLVCLVTEWAYCWKTDRC